MHYTEIETLRLALEVFKKYALKSVLSKKMCPLTMGIHRCALEWSGEQYLKTGSLRLLPAHHM